MILTGLPTGDPDSRSSFGLYAVPLRSPIGPRLEKDVGVDKDLLFSISGLTAALYSFSHSL